MRRLWANMGSFHICLWAYTMTEAWAWGRSAEKLVDRSASPWDDASRRPSHADKRRAWRRELLGEEIRAALRPGTSEEDIQAVADRLLNLAALHALSPRKNSFHLSRREIFQDSQDLAGILRSFMTFTAIS